MESIQNLARFRLQNKNKKTLPIHFCQNWSDSAKSGQNRSANQKNAIAINAKAGQTESANQHLPRHSKQNLARIDLQTSKCHCHQSLQRLARLNLQTSNCQGTLGKICHGQKMPLPSFTAKAGQTQSANQQLPRHSRQNLARIDLQTRNCHCHQCKGTLGKIWPESICKPEIAIAINAKAL